jgi:hypothetical protein
LEVVEDCINRGADKGANLLYIKMQPLAILRRALELVEDFAENLFHQAPLPRIEAGTAATTGAARRARAG